MIAFCLSPAKASLSLYLRIREGLIPTSLAKAETLINGKLLKKADRSYLYSNVISPLRSSGISLPVSSKYSSWLSKAS